MQTPTAAESGARVRAPRALTETVGETRGVEKGHDLHNTMELIRRIMTRQAARASLLEYANESIRVLD